MSYTQQLHVSQLHLFRCQQSSSSETRIDLVLISQHQLQAAPLHYPWSSDWDTMLKDNHIS